MQFDAMAPSPWPHYFEEHEIQFDELLHRLLSVWQSSHSSEIDDSDSDEEILRDSLPVTESTTIGDSDSIGESDVSSSVGFTHLLTSLQWQQYQDEQGHRWWYCINNEDFFYETNSKWTLYKTVCGRKWWFNEDKTTFFFVDTGSCQ